MSAPVDGGAALGDSRGLNYEDGGGARLGDAGVAAGAAPKKVGGLRRRGVKGGVGTGSTKDSDNEEASERSGCTFCCLCRSCVGIRSVGSRLPAVSTTLHSRQHEALNGISVYALIVSCSVVLFGSLNGIASSSSEGRGGSHL